MKRKIKFFFFVSLFLLSTGITIAQSHQNSINIRDIVCEVHELFGNGCSIDELIVRLQKDFSLRANPTAFIKKVCNLFEQGQSVEQVITQIKYDYAQVLDNTVDKKLETIENNTLTWVGIGIFVVAIGVWYWYKNSNGQADRYNRPHYQPYPMNNSVRRRLNFDEVIENSSNNARRQLFRSDESSEEYNQGARELPLASNDAQILQLSARLQQMRQEQALARAAQESNSLYSPGTTVPRW